MKERNRDEVEVEINKSVELIVFTKQKLVSRGRFAKKFEPSLDLFSPILHVGPLSGDWWSFHADDVTSPDLVWPIDFCMAWNKVDEVGEEKLHTVRVQSAPLASFRGLTDKFAKHMMHVFVADIYSDRFYTSRRVAGWQRGKWCDLYDPADSAGFDETIKMLTASALRRRYTWCVSFGIDDSPKIMIETDPVGLRQIFKDRDKDPDRDRRAALRHWVRDHARLRRKDAEAESFVRRHLRGRTPFKWRGFDCVVEPAIFDVESNGAQK